MEREEFSDRVAKLETSVAKLEKKSVLAWERWLDVISKLFLPILLFWLALTFKDAVQQALESRRLEVTSAGAIEQLLQTLHQPEIDVGKATAAALTLSAYGEAAIMPLVGALEHGSSNTETAATRALFILGLSHPDAVTQKLSIVLSKRAGQFRWQTHKAAIEILGKIAYPEARTVLLSYKPLIEKSSVEGLIAWGKVVQGANEENYKEMQKKLMTALAVFDIDSKPSGTGDIK
jgi:hypothetical protein